MTQFVVMGSPIAHSQSPFIHEEFGRLVGLPVRYGRKEVAPGGLARALEAFATAGGRGVNITVPLKGEAFALAGRCSERAALARAVNTLWWEGDTLVGDNTDGVGLVRDLVIHQGLSLRGRTVFMVGAGGAAQGIAGPLLAEGLAKLVLYNRTPERAHALVAALGSDHASVASLGAEDGPFDLIINATAAGLSAETPALPGAIFQGAIAYDLMYGYGAEPFLSYGRTHGARLCVDGLGMLVEQAAEAFRLWHGVHPPTAPVLQQLRARLS